MTSFSRAVAHDAVPGDQTELAIGLGRPIWKGLAPLAARKKPGRRVEDHCYLPLESREKILKEVMGPKRAHKVIAWHCKRTKQVLMQRKQSNEDSKEPPELMPGSYREAQERAWKVAAEVRAAAAESDSLFGASALMSSMPFDDPSTFSFKMSCKAIPDIVKSPPRFGFQKQKQQPGIIPGTFMSRSIASRMAGVK